MSKESIFGTLLKQLVFTVLLAGAIISSQRMIRRMLLPETHLEISKFVDENSVNLSDSKEEVLRILGEPTSKMKQERWVETWKYKDGDVLFGEEDLVCGWENSSYKLKVKINNTNVRKGNPKILMNSSIESVLELRGTPSSINIFGNRPYYRLKYGKVQLVFFGNKLLQYSNPNNTFKIEFSDQAICKGYLKIDLGIPLDQIVACLGMPIEISRHGTDAYTWDYENYVFTIESGEVVGYQQL